MEEKSGLTHPQPQAQASDYPPLLQDTLTDKKNTLFWVESLSVLFAAMEKDYAQGQYPWLLANLQLCVKVMSHPASRMTLAFLHQFLPRFKVFCVVIDAKAHEYNFRDALNQQEVRVLYQALEKKLSEDDKAALDFKAFFEELLYGALVDSQHGKVNLPALCEHPFAFHHFFDPDESHRFDRLKKTHTQRTSALAHQVERNRYGFLSESVITYWKTLAVEWPDRFKAADKRPLMALGNGLWDAIRSDPTRHQPLWQLLLVLYSLFAQPQTFKAQEDDHTVSSLQETALGVALQRQAWANQLGSQSTDAQVRTLLTRAIDQSLSVRPGTVSEPCPLFDFETYKAQLDASREGFTPHGQARLAKQAALHPMFAAQKAHTAAVMALLNQFVSTALYSLGPPPAKVAFCVLGSTSRQDRRPYSDLEFLVLYTPLDTNRAWVDYYVFQLMSLVEMQVIGLNETHHTHQTNAGFHVDSSSHVFAKGLWGTPEAMAKRFVTELAQRWKADDQPGHPWLFDESFYSLLAPVLIQPESPDSWEVWADFRRQINAFLRGDLVATDAPERLVPALPLPPHATKRHQIIAWACLQTIVRRSVAHLTTVMPGDTIDIKQVYYKPLTYLALNLKLFYGLKARHPGDILAAVAALYPWGGDLIHTLLSQALAFITTSQVALHVEKGYQEEERAYLIRQTADEALLWPGLDLVAQGLILPLGKALDEQCSTWDLKTVGYAMLQGYLTAREPWLARWQKAGIPMAVLLVHPLLQALATTPSPNGWSPHYERLMADHLQQLMHLTRPLASSCRVEGLPTGQTPVYLPDAFVKTWFNAQGDFQGDHAYSGKTSRVRRIEGQDTVFYVKCKAGQGVGLMGREFAVQTLHLLLGGPCQVALGWPLKLTYAKKGVEKTHYVWLSREVEGDSLGEVMTHAPQRLTADALEKESYSQQVLLAYLTCPEDGQPANFKVQATPEGFSRLLGIDLGQSFVQSHRRDKTRQVICLKTMVYVLDGMAAPLAESVLTRCKLITPFAWLTYWQTQLTHLNRLFKPLLNKALDAAKVPQSDFEKYNRFVDLSDSALHGVSQRFEVLQTWLKRLDYTPTGWHLLERLNPLVALSYQSLRGHVKTPHDFYQIDPKAYVKDPRSGKMYSSTTFKQIQDQTLTPAQLHQSFQLTATYFDAIDFGALRSEAHQHFTLELLHATAHAQGASFRHLNLAGCTVLTESTLLRLLQQMPQVKHLTIERCPLLTEAIAFTLLGHRYDYSGLFWLNYAVLCAPLQAIQFTRGGKREVVAIALTQEGRQQLTGRIARAHTQLQRVIDALLKALGDKGSYVRQAAAGALVKVGHASPAVIDALLKALRDEKYDVREAAAAGVLVKVGHTSPAVIDALLKALRDEKYDVREAAAAGALGKVGHTSPAPAVIDALLTALGDEKGTVRQAAASALGQVGHASPAPAVIDALLTALGDKEWTVRVAAVEALGQVEHASPAPAVIDALLTALGDEEWAVRHAAAGALGQVGHASPAPAVIDTLLTALGDEKWTVREAAASALGKVGHASPAPAVIDALLTALGDEEWNVRKAAAGALGKVGHASPAPAVIDALLTVLGDKDKDWTARGEAARALGQVGHTSPAVIDALLTALGDKEWTVRVAAVEALGQVEHASPAPAVIDALLTALGDEEWAVRHAAAGALGQVGHASPAPAVIDTLLTALGDEKWTVREAAASALGKVGHASPAPAVIDALLTALGDEEWNVRKAAAGALGKVGHASPAPAVIDALLTVLGDKDKDWTARGEAARALGQVGHTSPAVIDALLTALGDKDWDVRIKAAGALGQVGHASPAVIDALLTALGDKEWAVRSEAAGALGQVGHASPAVIDALLTALGDKEWAVRSEAAGALGQVGHASPAVIDALLTALGDKDGMVRHAAAGALGKVGHASPAVIDALLTALGDKDWAVRKAAAGALGQVGHASPTVIDALLTALGDKEYDVRHAAAGALGQLCTVDCRLAQLKAWAIDKTVTPVVEKELTGKLTKHVFFFVTDVKSLHALPCVSKEWKRLYEQGLEAQGEARHRLLFGLNRDPLPEKADEADENLDFKRFLKH